MWPVGETSTEWTPLRPGAITRAFDENPVRAAFRWIARSDPLLTCPKTTPPPSARTPRPWKTPARVIPIAEAVTLLGPWWGAGPDLFVPGGVDTEHDSFGP